MVNMYSTRFNLEGLLVNKRDFGEYQTHKVFRLSPDRVHKSNLEIAFSDDLEDYKKNIFFEVQTMVLPISSYFRLGPEILFFLKKKDAHKVTKQTAYKNIKIFIYVHNILIL